MKRHLLIGNPNVGKTTIYNNLTGKNETISNFEGVTIQRKEAEIAGTNNILVDLPGVNSISGNSLIEKTVVKALLNEDYDSIIYVVDINNIKRNFYMLLDILETGAPLNLLFNMKDLFDGDINLKEISNKLNCNSHLISKNECINYNSLNTKPNNFQMKYHQYIEEGIEKIVKEFNGKIKNIKPRFLALQVLVGNTDCYIFFNEHKKIKKIVKEVETKIVENKLATSIVGLIFLNKREFVNQLLENNYRQESYKSESTFINRYFDKILLHKFWGYICFAFIMWLVFLISFQFSFLADYIDAGVGLFTDLVTKILTSININEGNIIYSFLVDGVIAGISGILTFIPQIIILFALLTFLEGVGYFARVSVLFENLFNKIGLSAHSLIPLISGLGCNVLSIISTRSIKNDHKRIATIMAAPYISCSARFPIYIIFVEVFFKNNKALVLLSIYLLGILVTIGVAYLFDKIIFKDKGEMGVVTLPKYKAITFSYFLKSIIAKIKGFVSKAGKLIFVGTLIVWGLTHFNFNGFTNDFQNSFMFALCNLFVPLFQPLGFATSEAVNSLVSAFFAKELAVSSMMVSYGVSSQNELSGIIADHYTIASSYAFMIFTLLYIPCISTLGVIYSETKQVKYVVYSVVLSLGLGYFGALISYNLINLFI